MLIDSHCHLDFPELSENLEQVLAQMQQNDVGAAVCIGVSLEDFPCVLALAEQHSQLFASVGVHPEGADVLEPTVDELVRLADHPKVIAIGETGLDYYWQKDAPEWQRDRFRTHIRAAIAIGKPLVIHNRDATADTLRLLTEEGAGRVGELDAPAPRPRGRDDDREETIPDHPVAGDRLIERSPELSRPRKTTHEIG